MFDLVIRGGVVVRPDGQGPANLGVTDGVIRAVAAPGEEMAGNVDIDATGKFILPGLVDAHVHIPGYLLSKRLDDFRSATTAAAVGGVTTIMLMPTDDPRTATSEYFQRKRRSGEGQSFVDFAIQVLIGPKTESIEIMAADGAVSFELFLAYGGNPEFIVGHDDYELQRLLRLVAEVDGIAGITPHSASLIAKLTQLQKALEHWSPDPRLTAKEVLPPPVHNFALTRPTLSEGLGIARACTVASETGTRLHLRSLSSKSSVAMVGRFQDAVRLSSEVMSHHLLFTEEDAAGFGPYGVIVPPLRSEVERASLRQALRDGAIDMVVSDHSPVLRESKELGWANVWQTPPGMPGLQTLCASMLALVDDGALSMTDIVRCCAERPAASFGLHPRKGALVAGADADIVIVNPARPQLIEDRQQRSRADYTTLKGRTVSSRIEDVFLRGTLIARDGEIAAGPIGRFVRP